MAAKVCMSKIDFGKRCDIDKVVCETSIITIKNYKTQRSRTLRMINRIEYSSDFHVSVLAEAANIPRCFFAI